MYAANEWGCYEVQRIKTRLDKKPPRSVTDRKLVNPDHDKRDHKSYRRNIQQRNRESRRLSSSKQCTIFNSYGSACLSRVAQKLGRCH